MDAPFVRASGLTKQFGTLVAVDQLDLSIRAGEIYGLVGPDGAGKTTTLRCLVGALKMGAGKAEICGFDIQKQTEKAREKLGYLSQRFSLYEDLTVLENIRFFAEVRGLNSAEWYPRCMEILEFVDLAQFKDRRAGQLSGGMKQKLGLASALVSRPRVLLLDEPTTGVDPITRQDFWQLLIQLVAEREDGVCVVISTPYMDEAARCNRIGFMKQGHLIREGTPAQMRAPLDGCMLELHGSPMPLIKQIAEKQPGVQDVRVVGERLRLRVEPARIDEVSKRLVGEISAQGGALREVRPVQGSLEDVYIALTEMAVS